MARLGVTPVSFQPHVVISNPEYLSSSLVLRIPEYINPPGTRDHLHPHSVKWQVIEQDVHIKYHCEADEQTKQAWGVDFWGEARGGEGEVSFEVTEKNVSDKPHSLGVSLFCMQAGQFVGFHDPNQIRTFVRTADRWARVNERLPTEHNLIAKVNDIGEWVLATALDQPNGPGGNPDIWPSCLHTNPSWKKLEPGQTQTAHGKLYFFRGDLDDVYERYKADFLDG